MSYAVDWFNKVVTVPLGDLVSLGGGEYNFILEDCHVELRRLESDPLEGGFANEILEYTREKTISGTTLAAVVEIVNGYTFVFPVAAAAVNLLGANTNLGELGITPANGVSIRPQNSAGHSTSVVGSGLSAEQATQLLEIYARLDLNIAKPNTYKDNLDDIVNDDFTLTKTDNGNGTQTVQRS